MGTNHPPTTPQSCQTTESHTDGACPTTPSRTRPAPSRPPAVRCAPSTSRSEAPLQSAVTAAKALWCSSTPPSRVRYRLQVEEVRYARVWRLKMRQLRQGPRRSCVPDRGAEDCQEGAQGVSAEEAISVSSA